MQRDVALPPKRFTVSNINNPNTLRLYLVEHWEKGIEDVFERKTLPYLASNTY